MSTATTLNDLLVNVYGGALIGVMITSTLFGIISVQAYKHFQNFPRDPSYVKLMIVFLWTLQAFELICTTKALYWYLISNFGNYFILVKANWEGTTYQTVSTLASMTTQTFFAVRVYQLSHSLLLGLFLEALVLLQCALGAVTAVKAYIYADFELIATHEKWLVLGWLAAEALSDTAIAASMVLLLRSQRTGFDKTDSMINRLVIYSINTGAVTSLVAIITMITFAIAGFHFLVLALAPSLGALYTVTMLANLHARTGIRRRFYSNPTPIPMTTVGSSNSGASTEKRMHTLESVIGTPVRKDPSFGGFSSLGGDDRDPQSRALSRQSYFARSRPSITAPSPAAFPSRGASTPRPQEGIQVHIQKQQVVLTDVSPPTTVHVQSGKHHHIRSLRTGSPDSSFSDEGVLSGVAPRTDLESGSDERGYVAYAI